MTDQILEENYRKLLAIFPCECQIKLIKTNTDILLRNHTMSMTFGLKEAHSKIYTNEELVGKMCDAIAMFRIINYRIFD